MRNKLLFVLLVSCSHLLMANARAQVNGSSENYWLGDNHGPYLTGTFSGMWIDESRAEYTTSDPDDRRRVMFQVWYPSTSSAGAQYAPYIDDITLFQDYVRSWGEQVADLPTRSILNAPVDASGAPFPVLLYSHGGNAPYFTGTAQCEFLASHGYVVVSVAHTDDSALVRFPDGVQYEPIPVQQLPSEEEQAGMSQLAIYEWQKQHLQAMQEWHVQDLIFALNTLAEMNASADGLLSGRLDVDHIGAFGWSRGGATSLQVTIEDTRVKAAVNLDGYTVGRSIESRGTDRPILMIENPGSYANLLETDRVNAQIEELISVANADVWRMMSRSTGDWYRAFIVDSYHEQFSDFPLANASPPEEYLSPQRVRDMTNTVVLEFFDRYLKGQSETGYLTGADRFPEFRLIRAEE